MAALSEVIDGLDLNTGGYRVAARDFGSVSLDILMRGRARHRPDALVSAVPSGTRSLSYVMEIEGSSKDNTIALYTALLEKMPKTGTAKNLVVTPSGATNAVTFVCNAVDGEMPMPYDLAFDAGNRAVVSFTLLCEPYAYGPAVTALNAVGITSPCVIDVGTVLGDYPTPLTIDLAWDASAHVQSLWCGRLAPGSALTIADLLQECEGGTWVGGTTGDTGHSAAHGAYYRWNTSNSLAARFFADQTFDPGDYLVMVRTSAENAADDGYFSLYSSLTLQKLSEFWMLHPNPGLSLQSFGRISLPAGKARGASSSSLSLGMRLLTSTGAGHSTWLDYIMFCPTSWGYFHVSQVFLHGTDLTSLRLEGGGAVYQNNVQNCTSFAGGPISAVGPTKLALFTQSGIDVASEHHGCVAVTYTPRYALWR